MPKKKRAENNNTPPSVRLSAGIALLYLHLHAVFEDASLLQKALEHAESALRRLTRRHDVTFLCGDAGPLAVAAVVYRRLQRAREADECVARSAPVMNGAGFFSTCVQLRVFIGYWS